MRSSVTHCNTNKILKTEYLRLDDTVDRLFSLTLITDCDSLKALMYLLISRNPPRLHGSVGGCEGERLSCRNRCARCFEMVETH